MSKFQARAALDQFVGRPVLVSESYAGQSLGPNMEVTSGLMSDIRELANTQAEPDPEVLKANCRTVAAAYNFDITNNDKPFMFADGFALIPIHGLLINRYQWSWSLITGYNFIRNQLAAAMADEDVKAVIFDVNSPGGMVSGCQETADMIFDARSEKPLIAVVDANCHSAAYYLASQCTHVAITPTGNTANIGVFRLMFDVSEALAQMGITVNIIKAGAHKVDGNPFEPLSDDVREEFQADVDAIYDVFVAAVARGRGIDEQAVRDTEARCYGAADALALGLVDAIENPSDAVEAYLASCEDMMDTDDAGDDEPDDTQPEPQETNMNPPRKPVATATTAAAPATPATEVTSVDTDALAADARAAERTRISGIQNHPEAEGRGKLASHLALQTDMSVEQAGAILAASPKEQAAAPATATATSSDDSPFNAAMARSEQPNIGAGGGGTGSEAEAGTLTPGQRILAAQRKAGNVSQTKH